MDDIFGKRLKEAREKLKWTQSQLSTHSGLSISSIAQFETNTRKPSFSNLRRLATALQVTTDFLLGRVDESKIVLETGNALFRHLDNISGEDRKLLEAFAEMLAERNKNAKELDQKLIKNRAEKIVHEHGILSFPVNPKIIAEKNDIVVTAKNDCTEGVSGILLKVGDQCGIMYSTFYNNTGFENFSISHELGHYFLDGHLEKLLESSGIHESKAGFFSSDRYEREADIFAASLLMPEDLFKDNIYKYDKGLNGIIGMADMCNTSLTATAIRYTELTDDFLIVIISTAGKINFCCFSQKAWHLKNKTIPKKGSPVPKNTATDIMSRNLLRIHKADKDSTQTDLSDWIECEKSITVIEEVKGLGRYGKVLTVLSLG